MDIPALVESAVGEDSVVARVPLGGDDALFATPSRTLVYRAEGLLSDESVEEYTHNAERISVSEGRRKSKITLDYGLDGEETLTVPSKHLDDALKPILAGVLDTAGITDDDERVTHVFRFSELTLAITSKRLVKHIGSPVWDDDYEEFQYEDVTDLDFESGSVATSVVLTLNDRQERFKAPNEEARAVREGLESALLNYYDVESLEEFRVAIEAESEGEAEEEPESVGFGDGPDPLQANPGELPDEPTNATRTDDTQSQGAQGLRSQSTESPDQPEQSTASSRSQTQGQRQEQSQATREAESTTTSETSGFEGSGFEAAGPVENEDISEELAELRETIEQQNQQIQQQRQMLEQLIEELRRGR